MRVALALVVCGALALLTWAGLAVAPLVVRSIEARRLQVAFPRVTQRAEDATVAAAAPATRARAWCIATGSVGWMDIPRLLVSAPVKAGTDAMQLLTAVGHVSRTAFPGEPGNAVFAAHRDGYFRALAGLAAGDSVIVTTPDGQFLYQVAQTMVVAPDRTDVLAPTPEGELTLITCYPFRYLGPAPQRFIVRARLSPQGSWRW